MKNPAENCIEISGFIQSGIGRGSFFTSVEWVVRQCESQLGYVPYPGTLNVRIRNRDLHKLEKFFQETDMELIPDDPAFCSAPVKKVTVNGIPAAVVLPAEVVRVHENHVIEIISSCSFKASLGLKDGDQVTILGGQNSKKGIK